MTTPTRSEIEALRDRLRSAADEVESFPHPSHCDHLHIAHHVMREAADLLDALLKEPDLTYVQRERDQAVMRWQIAEERVKRLEAAMDAISSTDPIDAALDPQRAIYIARVVLSESPPESTPATP